MASYKTDFFARMTLYATGATRDEAENRARKALSELDVEFGAGRLTVEFDDDDNPVISVDSSAAIEAVVDDYPSLSESESDMLAGLVLRHGLGAIISACIDAK